MEFSVSKSDLVRELGLHKAWWRRKPRSRSCRTFWLKQISDQVWLTATDLELGIRCACPARIKKEGAGTIPARRLLDYVRLLPDADVQVKLAENQWASLVCGRSRTRIAGMSRESFPELPQMPEPLAEIPLSVLSQMISKHHIRDFRRRVALHVEWRLADFAGHRSGDGGDGWSPSGDGREARGVCQD